MDFNSWEKLTLIAILMLQTLDTSLEEFQWLVLSFFIVMDGSLIHCAIAGFIYKVLFPPIYAWLIGTIMFRVAMCNNYKLLRIVSVQSRLKCNGQFNPRKQIWFVACVHNTEQGLTDTHYSLAFATVAIQNARYLYTSIFWATMRKKVFISISSAFHSFLFVCFVLFLLFILFTFITVGMYCRAANSLPLSECFTKNSCCQIFRG